MEWYAKQQVPRSSRGGCTIMKDKLRQWFYSINHAKYRHYFEEWYNNLTPQQLRWYEKVFQIKLIKTKTN